jgi:uncharacterized glyoxalase superfamily protein PhnB
MTDTTTKPSTLHPRLIVAGASRAIAFYVEAFGAEEVSRYEGDDGQIVHAELRFGEVRFTLKDEEPGTPDVGPSELAGSPVILDLAVADADAVGAAMEKAGATVIYPIDDHPYGRGGRLRDPFGHMWMISQH